MEGIKQSARLVVDEDDLWGGLSAADIVRRVFHWSAVERWSCPKIANELNALGVPTSYKRANRGVRKAATAGTWGPGAIRRILMEPSYRGVRLWGRRSSDPEREIIVNSIEPLVSDQLWNGAQETLRGHALVAPDGRRRDYVLKSVISCTLCGQRYCGTFTGGKVWYRCGGQIAYRAAARGGRCPSKSLDGDWLEPLDLDDITRFLRSLGEILDELLAETNPSAEAAVQETGRITLEAALAEVEQRRSRAVDLLTRGTITEADFEKVITDAETERAGLNQRLSALAPVPCEQPQRTTTADLLSEIRRRVDGGLSIKELQQVVAHLVRRITVHTEVGEDGKKNARIVVEYGFPAVVRVGTGTRVGTTGFPAPCYARPQVHPHACGDDPMASLG